MAFLDTVIILTGQHQLLASFYQVGLDLPDPEPFGDLTWAFNWKACTWDSTWSKA